MEFNQFNSVIWISLIPMIFFIVCFYFTLTFFQHLKSGDTQSQKKAKIFAVVSLAIGLLAPTAINYFVFLKLSSF